MLKNLIIWICSLQKRPLPDLPKVLEERTPPPPPAAVIATTTPPETPPPPQVNFLPLPPPPQPKRAYLIFELESLEVFYYYKDVDPYVIETSKVYWRDLKLWPNMHYGPYPSIYQATRDYSFKIKILNGQIKEHHKDHPDGEYIRVIPVDFITKKRLDP